MGYARQTKMDGLCLFAHKHLTDRCMYMLVAELKFGSSASIKSIQWDTQLEANYERYKKAVNDTYTIIIT